MRHSYQDVLPSRTFRTPGITSSDRSQRSAVGSDTPYPASVIRQCRPPIIISRSTVSALASIRWLALRFI